MAPEFDAPSVGGREERDHTRYVISLRDALQSPQPLATLSHLPEHAQAMGVGVQPHNVRRASAATALRGAASRTRQSACTS